MTLRDQLLNMLAKSTRLGAETDEPEGARYIQISDTLARQLALRVRRAVTLDDAIIAAIEQFGDDEDAEIQPEGYGAGV